MTTLQVGSEWDSTKALKHACATYAIEHRFPTKIVRHNANQFDVRCKNHGCTWRLYASKRDAAKFVIKTFVDEHYNCPGAHLKNPAANSHFIANVIAAKIKKKPDYAIRDPTRHQPHTPHRSQLLTGISRETKGRHRPQRNPQGGICKVTSILRETSGDQSR